MKDYKKILEGIVDIINTTEKSDIGFTNICAYVGKNYPELKESENEKIRKQILSFLKEFECDHYRNLDFSSWIAWLEKQGVQNTNPDVPTREVILSIWDLGNEWKELTNGCISTEHGNQLNYIQKHWHESECYLKEKQGKKKTTDKVKPKFKPGDWVIDKQGIVHQIANAIENMTNHAYGYDLVDGGYINTEAEGVRLWTIQDAMDGDILVNDSNIFMFHFIISTHVRGYCHVNTDDGRFYDDIGNPDCFSLIGDVFTPATREQRDALFAGMKDAGYGWDADKKELKKI